MQRTIFFDLPIFAAMDKQTVFSIQTDNQFNATALEIFQYEAKNCIVYKEFIEGLDIDVHAVEAIEQIPFLPIEFYKSHAILSPAAPVEIVFTSSGTTGMITSSHFVTDVSWYTESFRRAFSLFYGDVRNYTILALLPAYLEREGSSLIYMVEDLIRQSGNPDRGFFLYDHDKLYQQLKKQQQAKKPTLLIGVTFALLDFVEKCTLDFPELIVMETGGM